jgi:hypothetical protein
MYNVLPVLSSQVSPSDFWALTISAAVVSSACSHYFFVKSHSMMLGASGYIMAIVGFLLALSPTEKSKVALRDTLLSEIGRLMVQTMQEQQGSRSGFMPSRVNYYSHIVRSNTNNPPVPLTKVLTTFVVERCYLRIRILLSAQTSSKAVLGDWRSQLQRSRQFGA